MTFTTTPPTAPGFYAWRAGKNGFTYNVKITDDLQAWYGAENQGPAYRIDGEWCRLVPAEEIQNAWDEAREWSPSRTKYDAWRFDKDWEMSRAKQVAEGTI